MKVFSNGGGKKLPPSFDSDEGCFLYVRCEICKQYATPDLTREKFLLSCSHCLLKSFHFNFFFRQFLTTGTVIRFNCTINAQTVTLLRSAAPRLAYSNGSSERINAFTRIVVKYMKIVAPKRYLILAIFLVPIWYSNALISSFTFFLRTSLKCGTDSWLTRMVLIYLVSALTRIQHLSNMLHFIFAYAILLILVLMCVVPVQASTTQMW